MYSTVTKAWHPIWEKNQSLNVLQIICLIRRQATVFCNFSRLNSFRMYFHNSYSRMLSNGLWLPLLSVLQRISDDTIRCSRYKSLLVQSSTWVLNRPCWLQIIICGNATVGIFSKPKSYPKALSSSSIDFVSFTKLESILIFLK